MGEESKLTTRGPEGRLASPGVGAIGNADGLMKEAIDQLGRVLDTKQVIGEPLVFGDVTIVPLLSVGFGFGAGGGGGGGTEPNGESGEGGGGGGGGGGGIKPIAVVIIDGNGARLEAIPEPASGFEKLGSAIASVMETRSEKKPSGA